MGLYQPHLFGNELVVGFVSDKHQEKELSVLLDMKNLGARTMAIVENSAYQNWSGIDFLLELRSGLTEWQRIPLYLPVIQWLGYYRSIDLGCDPDKPANLTQVIELDGQSPT
jgi:glucosamine--fructose-6-phosphate aminotransferase (isomerizing)